MLCMPPIAAMNEFSMYYWLGNNVISKTSEAIVDMLNSFCQIMLVNILSVAFQIFTSSHLSIPTVQ